MTYIITRNGYFKGVAFPAYTKTSKLGPISKFRGDRDCHTSDNTKPFQCYSNSVPKLDDINTWRVYCFIEIDMCVCMIIDNILVPTYSGQIYRLLF